MGEVYHHPAPSRSPQNRHHYDLYKCALRRCWLQPLVAKGERSAFVAHALHWLADLVDYADQQNILDRVHAGEPLRLSKAKLRDVTGIPDRTAHRYRTFLVEQELIRVTVGSWNGGEALAYSALIYIDLDKIAKPEIERRAQERAERRTTVGEPERERAERLSAEAEQLAQEADAAGLQSDPSPYRPGISPGPLTTTKGTRSRPQSNARANAERTRLPSGQRVGTHTQTQSRQRSQTVPYDPPSPADLLLAADVIAAYASHPLCHPLRRNVLGAAAVRCAGDAQLVRLVASLQRDGMPAPLLPASVTAELDRHEPGPDRESSPWVHSLARFVSTVHRAATAWKDPAMATANDTKRELCDLLRAMPGPRFGGNPDARAVGRELRDAGLDAAILNSHDLTTTLLDWVGNWWTESSADDNERAMLAALKA